MSYLINRQFIFNRIPKTGGSFVIENLKRNNFLIEEIGHGHDPYLKNDKKIFTYIRHPLGWFRSMWRFIGMLKDRNQYHKPPHNFYDILVGISAYNWHNNNKKNQQGFNEFLEKMIMERPGIATMVFKIFSKNCFYIGKQENINLKNIFLNIKKFDIKSNVSEGFNPIFPKSLAKEIMILEKNICDQFNYDNYEEFIENKKIKYFI